MIPEGDGEGSPQDAGNHNKKHKKNVKQSVLKGVAKSEPATAGIQSGGWKAPSWGSVKNESVLFFIAINNFANENEELFAKVAAQTYNL